MIKKEKPQCRRIVIPAPRLLSYSFHFCFPLQISFCPGQSIVLISTI